MFKTLTTFVAVASLHGCVTPTTIESSCVDPTFDRVPFRRVAVVALFDSTAESHSFEQRTALELEERGVDAVPAYSILDDGRMLEQAELRAKLAETQIEQVGARLRALNVKEETAGVG